MCGLAEHAEHAFLTKLFLHAVLGLVDTIGVDEKQATADVAEVASNEGVVGPESDGDVGLDVEEAEYGLRGVHASLAVDRWVVAAVTVVEVAGLEVDDADEHGDEDGILVISRHRVVQLGGDDLRGEALFGDGTEQVDSDGHGALAGTIVA